MTSLKDQIRKHVADPGVAVLIAETELEPALGQTAPIHPPTYARPDGDRSKDPYFAYSPESFVPEADESGWNRGIRRDGNGNPILAGRVEIDSDGSQATRSEDALWDARTRLGVALPGIVVTPPTADVIERAITRTKSDKSLSSDTVAAEIRNVFTNLGSKSSWQFAHRQPDAWVRYAANPDGTQVWAGGDVKDLVTSASAENADLLYRHFANACLFGFWLASGVAQRHRLPRAYSSSITGFGAHEVKSAATKLDSMGGASNTTKMTLTTEGVSLSGKGKPSDYGFGQVPTSPATRAFVCETILQQSSVSLPVLRSLRFSDDDEGAKNIAAGVVLTLLAIAGRTLSSEDGFLRSGCSLVPWSERWGWRRRLANSSNPIEELEIGGIDDIAAALRDAVADAEAVGLAFADPIELAMSEVQAELIAARVTTELGKAAVGDTSGD